MATTVWLALTLWLVMMIGELGVVTQSVSPLSVRNSWRHCQVAFLESQAGGECGECLMKSFHSIIATQSVLNTMSFVVVVAALQMGYPIPSISGRSKVPLPCR